WLTVIRWKVLTSPGSSTPSPLVSSPAWRGLPSARGGRAVHGD
ncbi:MAG: hypothetical protein AVDCRST_MAG77-2393, partial [uncultured Chloroflexi bacterium]